MSNKKKCIKIGDEFPEIKGNSTSGFLELPEEYKGRWFVLVSLIADFTPVCTTELIGFNEIVEKLDAIDCSLVFLSFDHVYSHINWIKWIKQKMEIEIQAPIIAGNNKMAKKLGLYGENEENLMRCTFIVNPIGIMRLSHYYPKEVGRVPAEIVRTVRALRIAGDQDVLTPANWPENKQLGEKVLISAPTDEESAKDALEDYDNYDWWFCYKSLDFE
ncbi:MAG: peroxiredoxin [Promethearchaeota archaeon]